MPEGGDGAKHGRVLDEGPPVPSPLAGPPRRGHLSAMTRPLLPAYYLATPLLALPDLAFGVPVRVAGLERVSHRLVYYAAVFAVGLVMRARPRLAPWLGMGESALNLTLLMAAVLVPVWSLAEAPAPAGGVVADLPARVATLALSGSVLVISFHVHQARALDAKPRRRGRAARDRLPDRSPR